MVDDPQLDEAATPAVVPPTTLPFQLPPALVAVIETLESRPTAIGTHEIHRELLLAIPDRRILDAPFRRSAWAEQIAFAYDTRDTDGSAAWSTYIKLIRSGESAGVRAADPASIQMIDADVLAYWAARARLAKHPSLAARFADLVWELTPVVTLAKRPAGAVEFARLAIDRYLEAARMDDGTAWADTRLNLGRALELATRVNDCARAAEAVNAHLEYVSRTNDAAMVGRYCYLFDNLLSRRGGPRLDTAQEKKIIAILEDNLVAIAPTEGGRLIDLRGTSEVGKRLGAYYERKGLAADRARVLGVVARAFERRAKIGNALTSVIFLERARECFLDAGLREEAERIQIETEALVPKAVEQLARTSVTLEVPTTGLEEYLNAMVSGGLDDALHRFVLDFVPDQATVAARAEESAKGHPVSAMLASQPVKLGDFHIEADVGDSTGDPDGLMAHRTAEALQLQVPWISWTLERLVKEGLTAEHVLASLEKCPLFEADRMALLRDGLRAHFDGSHAQAVHLLIPQIERAVVGFLALAGKASTKPHQTARGVMQVKNLNDVLPKAAWPVPGESGENLRMYLLSTLAHPKGLNIRNAVCHGLWPAERFTLHVSERILHVLLTIGLVPVQDCAPSPSRLPSPPAPP